MLYQLLLFAQDTAAEAAKQGTQKGTAPPPGGMDNTWIMLMPIIVIGFLYFIFMSRSSKKQDQERKSLIDSLKKNDKVLTVSGIIGSIVSVSETEDEVVVKLDDNVRVRMIKASISRNLTQEEAAKAPKDGAEVKK
jgi:preprotein translocase subunit YajC